MPPFLLHTGDRTLIGAHYFFRRFSYSSRENTWKKVMGRRTRGRDLWSGLALQGSFFTYRQWTLQASAGTKSSD